MAPGGACIFAPMTGRRTALILAVSAALALGLATAPLAAAAFPGTNGKIYFHSCGDPCGNFDVYAVNPDGSGLENVTDVVTDGAGPPDSAFYPSVSADGKRLAFGVDTQATSEIWVMNTDGTGALQLTKDNLLDQEPTISPDGTRIAWNQWSPFPGYTDRDIWVMNADGSGQQLLFDGSGEDYYPQFTPDGQTIVMGSETGDLDIRKTPSVPALPPATTATGVAEDNAQLENEPAVSPDGKTVAFAQRPLGMPLGQADVYAAGINGGPSTPLFATGASETSPAYSPDGTKIVFDSDGSPMVANADGSGTPVPLNVGTLAAVGRFDWVPKQPEPLVAPAPPPPAVTPLLGKPASRLGKHPAKQTRHRRARFTFSSDQPSATFQCKLDRKRFAPCRSPFRRKVKVGAHTFRVRAVNTEGASDPTPAVFRWKVLAG